MTMPKIKQLKARLEAEPVPISDHAKERHLDPQGITSAQRLQSKKTARIIDEQELRNINSVFRSEAMMEMCVDHINNPNYLPILAYMVNEANQDPPINTTHEIHLNLKEHPELFELMLNNPANHLICYVQNAESMRTRAHLATCVNIVLTTVPITKDRKLGIEVKTMYPTIDKEHPSIDVRYAPEVFRRQKHYLQNKLKDCHYQHVPHHLIKQMHAMQAELANSRYANRVANVYPNEDGTAICVDTRYRLTAPTSKTKQEPFKALIVTSEINAEKQIQQRFQFAMCTEKIEYYPDEPPMHSVETVYLDEPVPPKMCQKWLKENPEFNLAIAIASRAPLQVDDLTLDQQIDLLLKAQKVKQQQPKKTKRTPIANAPEPVDHIDTHQYE